MGREEALNRARCQLSVLKVRMGSVVSVQLLLSQPAWLGTHWIGGRQWLCAGCDDGECPGCIGQCSRLVGFAGVAVHVGSRVVPMLLELSSQSWAQLELLSHMDSMDVVPGLVFEASRRRSRGSLRCEPVKMSPVVPELASFDQARLVNAVAVLYRLPLLAVGEDPDGWFLRVRPTLKRQLAAAAGALSGAT